MSHLPDTSEQDEMRIAGEWEINQIIESFGTAFNRDRGGAHVPAQNLSNFQVDQVRSVQRFVGGEDAAVHTPGGRRLEQDLKHRGSVDDDQRLFLSARTAAAGAGGGRTGWGVARRFGL